MLAGTEACPAGQECTCTDGDMRACGTNLGECQQGQQRCTDGVWSALCEGEVLPTDEACDEDALDEDCDGDHNEAVAVSRVRHRRADPTSASAGRA